MKRLFHKLGLDRFHNIGALDDRLLATDKVGIKLKQHIGAACEPVVTTGDRVSKGQVLGHPPVVNGKPADGCAGPCLDRRPRGCRHRRRRVDCKRLTPDN